MKKLILALLLILAMPAKAQPLTLQLSRNSVTFEDPSSMAYVISQIRMLEANSEVQDAILSGRLETAAVHKDDMIYISVTMLSMQPVSENTAEMALEIVTMIPVLQLLGVEIGKQAETLNMNQITDKLVSAVTKGKGTIGADKTAAESEAYKMKYAQFLAQKLARQQAQEEALMNELAEQFRRGLEEAERQQQKKAKQPAPNRLNRA